MWVRRRYWDQWWRQAERVARGYAKQHDTLARVRALASELACSQAADHQYIARRMILALDGDDRG
ncbi:hypothetical protein GCM10023353_11850 [Tomitella cavernea]|uniref:Uncharacterized protein n=1 Tax=Tomitella cavernea TaxID=1387982 RepID=A0ABP9CF83_9ACTN